MQSNRPKNTVNDLIGYLRLPYKEKIDLYERGLFGDKIIIFSLLTQMNKNDLEKEVKKLSCDDDIKKQAI